jgi:hypothetical protein
MLRLYTFLHNLLNVLVQIADKMGLQKKKCPYGAKVQVLKSKCTLRGLK